MKTITQFLAACLIAFPALAAGTAKLPVFQIRLVANAPSADAEPMALADKREGRTNSETLYVHRTVSLDQTALKSATVLRGTEGSSPRIQILFSDEGKQRFAELTRTNIGKRLAVVIAGQLCSAPIVRAEITNGTAEISGTFSDAQADSFALVITKSLSTALPHDYSCTFVLVQIDGATQQWALDHNKKPGSKPTWSDIRPYLPPFLKSETNGVPICPQGGKYTLGTVDGENGALPTCSIGGPDHSLLSE